MTAGYCPHCQAPYAAGQPQCGQCHQPLAQAYPQAAQAHPGQAHPGQAHAGQQAHAGHQAHAGQQPHAGHPGYAGQAHAATPGPQAPSPAGYGQPAQPAAQQAQARPAVPPTQAMPQAPVGAVQPTAAPADRPRKQQVMTQMAGQAMNMSTVFDASFKRAVPGWACQLAEPVGPSTGGGALAQQPLSLVAASGERLAIGKVNAAQRTVNVRGYEVVVSMCEQRFGRHLGATREDYDRFVDTMTKLFKTYGFNVTFDTSTAGVSQAGASKESGGGGQGIWLLLLLAAVVVALLVVALVMISNN